MDRKERPKTSDAEKGRRLMQAVRNGHIKIAQHLLETEGVDVNTTGTIGFTPLIYAARSGYTKIVQHLLKVKGIDVNATITTGFTALIYAARGGHIKIVELLLKAGADMKATTTGGFTASYFAERNLHMDIVMLLRKAEANLGPLLAINGEWRPRSHHTLPSRVKQTVRTLGMLAKASIAPKQDDPETTETKENNAPGSN